MKEEVRKKKTGKERETKKEREREEINKSGLEATGYMQAVKLH